MEGTPPRLMALFLPAATRRRLRQQRLDEEAARDSVPWISRVDVTVTELRAGGEPSRQTLKVQPVSPPRPNKPFWYRGGGLTWDGTVIRAYGNGDVAQWRTVPGGVRPGFGAEEVAEAGIRPAASGECPSEVVEIAGVGLKEALRTHPIRRLYLLDEESRHLAVLPFLGLHEDEIGELAERAGVPFRRYALAHTAPFHKLCEALFPASAQAWQAVPPNSEYIHWWQDGWPPRHRDR